MNLGEHKSLPGNGPTRIDSETQTPSVFWQDQLQQRLPRFLWLGQAGGRKRRENIKHCQVVWVRAGNKHVTCFPLARTQLHHNGEQWRMWTNGVSRRRGIGLGDQLCGVFHFPSMPITQEKHCSQEIKIRVLIASPS